MNVKALRDLAQQVIDLYAQEKSAGDDDLFQALVNLGDAAQDIITLCDTHKENHGN